MLDPYFGFNLLGTSFGKIPLPEDEVSRTK